MKIIKINPADNVAVAIDNLTAGEVINVAGNNIILKNNIPAGHKILLTSL